MNELALLKLNGNGNENLEISNLSRKTENHLKVNLYFIKCISLR